MLLQLQNARDIGLQDAYMQISPADRAHVMEFEAQPKDGLVAVLAEKLGFWKDLPYRLIAVFGVELGLCSIDAAVECARDCLQEYTHVLARGDGTRLHRVCHVLMGVGTAARAQLQLFAQGGVALRDMALLYHLLNMYARLPIKIRNAIIMF